MYKILAQGYFYKVCNKLILLKPKIMTQTFSSVKCIVVAILLFSTTAVAQVKNVTSLQMPLTASDEMPGRRGASVVWHPVQKKYYAFFAGNKDFPMGVFKNNGTLLSSEFLRAGFDTRSLWYDTYRKSICATGYDNFGWAKFTLSNSGTDIADISILKEGKNQPTENSVGAYDSKNQLMYFLNGNQVEVYNSQTIKTNNNLNLKIHFGIKNAIDIPDQDTYEIPENYNNTSLIYTGIKNSELGVLNTTDKAIELYSKKTGLLTKTINLPSTAPTETSFNFAYTNGIYWLFDMDARIWRGYK
jgi:hypothetical protein